MDNVYIATLVNVVSEIHPDRPRFFEARGNDGGVSFVFPLAKWGLEYRTYRGLFFLWVNRVGKMVK